MDISSADTWKFINTFAPWLSALGTIAAVITSLYFARREKKIRLEVSGGYRLLVTPGTPEHQEYLLIHVVNVGLREAQITNIRWKVGIFKRQCAVQLPINNEVSSKLPVRLKDGEEAKYLFPLWGGTDWVRDFAEQMLRPLPFPRLQAHFIWIQVLTSVGKTFGEKIEKGLRQRLIEQLKIGDAPNSPRNPDAQKPRAA